MVHLGFLTAASPEERDILQVVSDALSGELHVSRRATIAADIVSVREDGTKDVVRTFALNDMALTRGPLSDMVEFDITVSGHHIDRLRGDGVVVSTATGSTGYALSAGGPIVSPDYTGMVCVPIAPHTIQARAFLTSPSDASKSLCPMIARAFRRSLSMDSLLPAMAPLRAWRCAAGPEMCCCWITAPRASITR